MSFTSNEKSYGGYSSFSPLRHAEGEGEKQPTKDQEYVHDKAEEIMEKQKEKDEGKAWAVAWSILCKYKNPSSEHCKKNKGEYFPSRKKASYTREELKKIKRVTKKVSGALDKASSVGLRHIARLIKVNTKTEREEQIIYYLWTHGKFPSFLTRYGLEARILGKIAGNMHYEKKPVSVSRTEERVAYKTLAKIINFCHIKWSSKVWAKVWFLSEDVSYAAIRLEMLNRSNAITHSVEYSRLIRHLFKG